MAGDELITVTGHATITYESESKAKDAFLDVYFGDGRYDREKSAAMAGVDMELMDGWFLNPLFFRAIEKRLQQISARKSSMQESVLENAHNMLDSDVGDLWHQTDSGNMILKSLKSVPKSLTSCIKKITLIRKSVNGIMGDEFTEALGIEMYDKVKVMNIMADYTNIRNTVLKTTDSGQPRMVGMSLVTALPRERAVDANTESVQRGQVQHEPEADTGTG